ncbi:hypothetical protein GGR58DRAFT_525854 [Xylaria digitata]|nr:hypothetical protein GGR58DRAFT_525854 [Xylaria digitata]
MLELTVLSQAPEEYLNHNEKKYQPHRSVVTYLEGQTTFIVGISSSHNLASHLAGTLVLCDGAGQTIGVLNAAELAAFRTALGSMLLFKRRRTTDSIIHTHLALLLRSQDIQGITIINPSARRIRDLIRTLSKDPSQPWPRHINLESAKPDYDVMEIDPALLKAITDPQGIFSGRVWKGAIVADSLGKLHHELNVGSEVELDKWARCGFVVYRSVGVGVMEIAIGERLLQMAAGCVGASIDNF